MLDRKKGRTSRKILKRSNSITVDNFYDYGTPFFYMHDNEVLSLGGFDNTAEKAVVLRLQVVL